MKEFDFDELDKAVNSLMGDVKKTTPSPPTASEPAIVSLEPAMEPESAAEQSTDQLATPAPPSPASELAAVQPEALALTAPLSPAPAPAVRRTGGRFMDVVRPSSGTKTAAPVVAPSRVGINLQPLTPSIPMPGSKVMNDVTAPAQKRVETQPPAVEAKTVEPEVELPTEVEPTSTSEPNEPWSSPFLPDTQVEKRPLGGLPDTGDTGLSSAIAAELAREHPDTESTLAPKDDVPSAEPTSLSADTEPTTLAPNLESGTSDENSELAQPRQDLQLAPEFDEKTVPAELDNDLVAIESGKASPAGETSEPIAATDHAPHAAASAVLSTSSIPQQYSETPSSGDVLHTPIYDNEAAHQPLNHPAKKKKGWVLIVFIVIIILLGGALGGVAYYFGLI